MIDSIPSPSLPSPPPACGWKPLWLFVLLDIAVWTLVAAISASAFAMARREQGLPADWWELFGWHFLSWSLWAIVTPFIFWLAHRLPLTPEGWPRALAVHGLASLAWMVIYAGPVLLLVVWQYQIPRGHVADSLGRIYGYRFFLDYLIYWLILLVAFALDTYRRYVRREAEARLLEARTAALQQQLAEAKVHFLQAQLHPHFLFNALNAVVGLTRRRENKAAIELLSGVGDLLRYALAQSREPLVPLARELHFARRYLEIQQARFGDRIDYRIDVGEPEESIYVPAMLLQPLLENAIEHGSPTPTARREIRISSRLEDPWLHLEVVNSRDPTHLAGESNGHGIGLSNLVERLEILFGECASCQLELLDDGYARVRLELPACEEPPAEEAP